MIIWHFDHFSGFTGCNFDFFKPNAESGSIDILLLTLKRLHNNIHLRTIHKNPHQILHNFTCTTIATLYCCFRPLALRFCATSRCCDAEQVQHCKNYVTSFTCGFFSSSLGTTGMANFKTIYIYINSKNKPSVRCTYSADTIYTIAKRNGIGFY